MITRIAAKATLPGAVCIYTSMRSSCSSQGARAKLSSGFLSSVCSDALANPRAQEGLFLHRRHCSTGERQRSSSRRPCDVSRAWHTRVAHTSLRLECTQAAKVQLQPLLSGCMCMWCAHYTAGQPARIGGVRRAVSGACQKAAVRRRLFSLSRQHSRSAGTD